MEALIRLENVNKSFQLGRGFFRKKRRRVRAMDDLSLSIYAGEVLGLVGESGSGKTTVARSILALTKINSGKIMIDGKDIQAASAGEQRELRRDFAVVFQDPAANLNPRQRVEQSLLRPLKLQGLSSSEAKKRILEAMEKVKMDAQYLRSFPHELSGGQQQRIAIARALVLRPRVMILDEPTSALDISVQAQILNLLLDLQEEYGLSYLIITHDLNVIHYVCDRVVVMYMGSIVEIAPAELLRREALHPYTRILTEASPILNPRFRGTKKESLIDEATAVAGEDACRLVGRCPREGERCRRERPPLQEVAEGHHLACFYWQDFRERRLGGTPPSKFAKKFGK